MLNTICISKLLESLNHLICSHFQIYTKLLWIMHVHICILSIMITNQSFINTFSRQRQLNPLVNLFNYDVFFCIEVFLNNIFKTIRGIFYLLGYCIFYSSYFNYVWIAFIFKLSLFRVCFLLISWLIKVNFWWHNNWLNRHQ